MRTQVLTTMKLLGKERLPGEILDDDETGQISDKVMNALINQEKITTDIDEYKPTEQETLLDNGIKDAVEAERKAQELHTDIKTKLEEENQDLAYRYLKRRSLSLKVEKGDKGAKKELDQVHKKIRDVKTRIEDLESALQSAEYEANECHNNVERQRDERKYHEIRTLMGMILDNCKEIDKELPLVGKKVKKFRQSLRRLNNIIEPKSKQLTHNWMIEALIEMTLGTGYVPKERQFDSLFTMMNNLFSILKKRSIPDENPDEAPWEAANAFNQNQLDEILTEDEEQ